MKLKLAICARPELFRRVFCLVPHMDAARNCSPACSALLSRLFPLVPALVPFKRALRRGVESKREFGAVGAGLVVLL
jgi:hypothetical protein